MAKPCPQGSPPTSWRWPAARRRLAQIAKDFGISEGSSANPGRCPDQGAGRGACRVLGLSPQGYCTWLEGPVSRRDWDDAHLTDELADEHDITVGQNRVLRHEFTATGRNRVWLWDVSEHPTREGKLDVCAIKDVYSNKIVGYSIDSRMKSSVEMAAMRNAIALRSPVAAICHRIGAVGSGPRRSCGC